MRRTNRTRTHLKNRILVQDRGGAEFQTGGILLYVEDLKRDTNKDIGPKDIFELGSRPYPAQALRRILKTLPKGGNQYETFI